MCHKEEVGLLHVLSVVETNQEIVVISRQVSSVVKRRTDPRIIKVVEIWAIELNLHQLLYQKGLHLEESLLVQAEGQTIFMQSLATKNKRTLQMLLWVSSKSYF